MAGDATEYGYMVDPGMGGISSVVGTLPTGYQFGLGQTRVVGGVKYTLVYNSGNSQIDPGKIATSQGGSVGPYSVTISTASNTWAQFGAVVNVNVTATTGTYFWGAVAGRVGGLYGNNVSVPTGSAFYIGVNGTVELMPQSVITGIIPCGINLGGAASKTVTTGAQSGDCYIGLEII